MKKSKLAELRKITDGLQTEMRKIKDEMSDVRAALRQQLNIVADRLSSVERSVVVSRDRDQMSQVVQRLAAIDDTLSAVSKKPPAQKLRKRKK
jgi:uncharacterized coiled-coil protein SlyX